MTRTLARRWALGAAALLVALGTAAVAPASAAKLEVHGSGIHTDSAFACTDATLPTTTAAAGAGQTTVRVSSVPSDCAHRSMKVWLLDSSGGLVSSGQLASAAQGQNTVPMTTYATTAVASVVVTIGGWWIDATWTAPAPVDPTPPLGPITCYQLTAGGAVVTDAQGRGVLCPTTPSITSVSTWIAGGTTPHLLAEYALSTTQPRSLLVIDFGAPLFSAYAGDPATSSIRLAQYNGASAPVPGYACAERPVMRIVVTHPNTSWGAQTLSGGFTLRTTAQGGQICPPW